ncbi:MULTISPECIES: M36 family metallopeptidase [unclassified Janthinobacterium]|uniref:M36 family metallopeptidase n=1 Tax=unclassified Janthinobacterium TaxID=2610881 RepID=UPI001E408D5C|nr:MULTISPECIES: M36 family metallopeptidase [unclassified Janthinobacterium]
MIVLAYAGLAQAESITTENLTVFSNTRAGSAQTVLLRHAGTYGLPADLGNLVLTKVQESLTGKHYHYQQMLRGLPLDRAEIIVSIRNDGQLNKIFNETKHISATVDANAVNQLYVQSQISADKALDKGWNNMKVQHPLVSTPSAELVWVATKDGVQLARKVQIEAQMPTGGFVQYLNAHNGELIDSYSTSLPRTNKGGERSIAARGRLAGTQLDRVAATQAAQALPAAKAQSLSGGKVAAGTAAVAVAASGINGMGLVFDPDPRTALANDALTDTSPASAFDAAYSNKSLPDLTVSGGVYKLTGPYVNITNLESPNTAPSTTTNGVWTAKRGNNAFDDSNVYFHLDQSQRYIQSLGFTGTKGIINRPLDVDTDGVNGDDNSHYSHGGSNDYLAFGHGCVNDSEDADVILHEYGHGIQANINSNWSGGDTGAMGEGFGDYWAASYSYSTANGKTYHPEWAFSWDGHGACWGGRLTNRTNAMYNSTKTYGAHVNVTENGVTFQSDELWSAPLYESMVSLIAAGKPRANIDKIILEAHFGLGSNIKMPAMATAIVNAAATLYPGDPIYANTFRAKFEAQKILGVVVPPGPTQLEAESNDSIATANAVATANTTVSGNLSAHADLDYFKISLPAGKALTLTLTPNASSDYDLDLVNGAGTKLGSSANGTGAADTVTYTNSGASALLVYGKVSHYSGGTGATNGKYTLKAAW